MRKTAWNSRILNTNVVVPLKYFSNFWSSLDLPLINCQTELDLTWSKDFISEILVNTQVSVNPAAAPPTSGLSGGSATDSTHK